MHLELEAGLPRNPHVADEQTAKIQPATGGLHNKHLIILPSSQPLLS